RHVQQTDQLPSDQVVYAAITDATAQYRTLIDARGLALTMDAVALDLRVHEQLALLEGLTWVFVRVALPGLLAEHQIVFVEEEDVTVLGCTCGLGDRIGDATDHDARGCNGIGWMTRGDFITRRRSLETYAYHDIKTTGDASQNWEAQWSYQAQLVA